MKGKKENKLIYEGNLKLEDDLAPSYISTTNHKYIEINNQYFTSLFIINYQRIQTDLIIKKLIETNINMNISMFYEKLDKYKIIQELTYHIGAMGADIKGLNKNRQDMDLVSFTYEDAKYIRKEMQINNEEMYYLNVYITVFSKDIQELEYLVNKVEGLCESSKIHARRANFRQEQAFLSSLPIHNNHLDLKEVSKRNVLTNGLSVTYPFISSTIFDEKGIYIGINKYNDSLIFIDRFKEDYKNANMCVFGTTGAGKSYYIKLEVLRNRLIGREQYIIDPEREYSKLCENLNGSLIKIGPNSSTYINIFDIREETLDNKIKRLLEFFSLIYQENLEKIEEKIIKCYELKEEPIMEDLYNLLEDNKDMQIKLIPFVYGHLKFFNNKTTMKTDNSLIVVDIYDLGEENLKYGMYLILEMLWEKIKKDRNTNKIIYLDEVWKLIGATSNKKTAGFVYEMFKTIRKYGGSAVAITQDISDLFNFEEGIFGKTLLNNSNFKVFFPLEEENIKFLETFVEVSPIEKIEIKSLKRGECLYMIGNEHVLAEIKSADFEKEVIEKGNYYEENSNCNGS